MSTATAKKGRKMKPVEKKKPRVVNQPAHTQTGHGPGETPDEGCTPAREDGGAPRPPRP